jgi:LAGLIDADG DNA endonuclease family
MSKYSDLPNDILQILVGNILGYASISFNERNKTGTFKLDVSVKNKDYLFFLADKLSTVCEVNSPKERIYFDKRYNKNYTY